MYLIISSCCGVITWCCNLWCTVFLPLEWNTGLGMLKKIKFDEISLVSFLTNVKIEDFNVDNKHRTFQYRLVVPLCDVAGVEGLIQLKVNISDVHI